jgi:xanthine dehydrogenase YagS FAD-binding subunit
VRPFRYERPVDAAAAVALLAGSPRARFLGGGTNLVDLMRLGVEEPDLLVDVSGLPYDRIETSAGGGLRIGAAVRNSDLASDRLVRERYPVLAEALLDGASGQLRNLATVGGNLLQRTRCRYFQDVTKPCNKRDPGSGCPAREGEHRNLALLGWSERCVATHPSDMAVALAALDAQVQVLGPDGARTIPFPELHRLVGDDPARDTTLAHGELITAIDLPPLPAGTRSAYRKVRDRASYAYALVSVAAVVTDDGVRLALGGVAHAPWRATRAEELLRGRPLTDDAVRAAMDAELAAAQPQPGIGGGNGFKIPLVNRTVVATLRQLTPEARA